ncbi:type III-B CRISPR module RAMP protein Cmr4 [Herpetosiphon llansteffanensis]|uniref:type III-B CRISPR module RAMP protein Cmr4 n=1 Tax=Herpetosiphon llansteffanensis TaxID=2094568 RepID=UPI000D7CAC0F|nr:type III-B CRISPR module RAMP protein Cmr4 [Herpetosiphon llansteffanensis]
MQTHLIFVHALSPIHAGTGQSVDVIDMPIAREKATNLPYIPGSSVKGVIRDVYADLEKRKSVFGTEEQAGDAIFADQRLLLLPIRSLYGTFAWVTSPYVLNRFAREAKTCFDDSNPIPTISSAATTRKDSSDPKKGHAIALVTKQSVLSANDTVYLEDLDIPASANPDGNAADAWAQWLGATIFKHDDPWQTILQERLCIVHDEIFNFLVTTATEITARIRLDDNTKVVEKGGLWYEEALPAETILAGIVAINDQKGNKNTAAVDAALEQVAQQNLIQFGGNATVGRGLCRLALVKGDRK